MMHARLIHSPKPGGLLELKIAEVVKRNDGHIERRVETRVFDLALDESLTARFRIIDLGNLTAKALARSNLLLRIEVLHIFRVTGRNENVFVTVEINIQENRRPRPIGGRHSSIVGEFNESAVASVVEKGIAHDLRAVFDFTHGRGCGRLGKNLAFAEAKVAAEHVDYENVEIAGAIEVGEIDAHRAGADFTESKARRGAKMSVAIIEPNAIGRPIIVADIKVGKAVAVNITKAGGESPVERSIGE